MTEPGAIMSSEIKAIPAVVEGLARKHLDFTAHLARELLPAARRGVTFAARGTSDNACLYGKYLFEVNLGLPVHLAAPSTVTLFKSPMQLHGHLVVGVSQSGESTDVCEYLEFARQAGARTLGITNNAESRLAKNAEFHLDLSAGQEKAVAATKTYVAELVVLRMLVAAMMGDQGVVEAVQDLPARLEAALAAEERIAALASRYRYMRAAVVLGRGYNFASAQEFALKLMETCYLPVHPFSFADFLHGPVAMLHEGFPTFVFLSRGPTEAAVKELMANVHGRGSELLVFSDQDIAQTRLAFNVRIAQTPLEMDSPIQMIMPAYLFAHHLAMVCGYNPDSPRGLTKVTHTR